MSQKLDRQDYLDGAELIRFFGSKGWNTDRALDAMEVVKLICDAIEEEEFKRMHESGDIEIELSRLENASLS